MPRRALPPHVRDAWQGRSIERLRQDLARATDAPLGAIVFDAYGTLFDVRSVEAACADLTDDVAAFAAHWRAKQVEYSWLRSLMGRYADFEVVTAEALEHTLARFDLRPNAAAKRKLLAAWLALDAFPDVEETLRVLKGLPLAILSNGSPAMLDALLRRGGLAKHFTAVLSVDDVKAYKPDPRVYALATAALGLPASRILFVTANAWDAVGAKNFGFRVAWCNRAGLAFDKHGPGPDVVVRSLVEVVGVVGEGEAAP